MNLPIEGNGGHIRASIPVSGIRNSYCQRFTKLIEILCPKQIAHGGQMKNRVRVVSGLAFAMLAGSFISAPNASAAGDCNTWKSSSAPWTGYAYCSKMGITDKFRVKVTCMGPDGKTWVAYGPWTGNTGTSKKKCADDPNIGVYKVGISFDH